MDAVFVLSLLPIPAAVFTGALRDRSLNRRPRFWLRFTALVICIGVPWIVELLARLSEQARVELLWAGAAWMMLLVSLAQPLLFSGRGTDPGPSDDGGPGPEDDQPTPPQRPTGGIPLLDAEQSATRRRGPHPPPPLRRPARRAPRERERRPARLWHADN